MEKDVAAGLRQYFQNVEVPTETRSQRKPSKNALLFLHTLAAGGSQAAVLELVPLFFRYGFQPWVVSLEDGLYREKFLAEGVPCGVASDVQNTEEIRAFLTSAFDLVFLNSVCSRPFAYYFLNTKTPVLWWIHETGATIAESTGYMPLPGGISENFTFLSITKENKQALLALYGKEAPTLPVAVKDMRGEMTAEEKDDNAVSFFLPGSYAPLKGQDVLIKAIAQLPPELAQKSHFTFCGYINTGEAEMLRAYAEAIQKAGDALPNVTVLGELSREETFLQYAACDCVVAPSRMDTMPTTIVEGMMFEKLTIASTATGLSKYMEDCVNGFVFPSENVDELYKRLALIISDKKSLESVAAAGRRLYETTFSPDAAEKSFREILKSIGIFEDGT